MRVLLDECLPRKLRNTLSKFEVTTVPEAGHAGLANGRLLAAISGRFDAFLTIDSNLTSQQTLATRDFGIPVLHAASNRLADLLPLVPEILAALAELQPGQVIHIPADS